MKLSAHICQYTLVQMARKISTADFEDMLKDLTIKAGVNGTGTLFLITDTQIYAEAFLVPLNDWLSTDQPPLAFFSAEERDTVVHNIRARAKAALKLQDPSSNACWAYFLAEVSRNFHFVFSFSPLHAQFRSRAQRFPALFTCVVSLGWWSSSSSSLLLLFLVAVVCRHGSALRLSERLFPPASAY